ncbi:MAG TPA: hypothetical protein VLB44_16715 [Kofleriaceae bacterium]|nr:hypothetical protein [Kofleriaceae bacterium]
MGAESGLAAIRGLLARWRLRIWILCAAAIGLLLGLVPLFGVLGYELALVGAVFGSLAGLDLGAAHARELQWTDAPGMERASYPGRVLVRSTCAASGIAMAVTLVPALIAAVRGLWRPTCDWWFGIEAYIAMPLVSAVLAGALGHAIGVAVGTQRPDEARRDRPVSIVFSCAVGIALAIVLAVAGATIGGAIGVGVGVAIVLGAILWVAAPHRSTLLAIGIPIIVLAGGGLYRFYAAPPVFTYNAIIGYFPGNLYDENIELGQPLWWSRLEQLAWVVAVVGAVASRLDVPRYRITREPRPARRRVAPIAVSALATTAAVLLHLDAGQLGYSIDSQEIADQLGGTLETPHFVIHYAKTPAIEKEIALVAADHEFRYAQVVAQLGVAPPGKLTSYYFDSREQKARWIGAKNVEMAKPWRREIYIDARDFPHGSLRHEIAHAVASEFGDPIFGVASRRIAGVPVMVSPGLIEGLAVAIDWPSGYERLTPHEAVRAMQELGVTPTIRQLLSLQFLTVSSARSYTTAGSFIRYLLDKYGATALRKLYSTGGDFAGAYGKSITQLEAEWRAMISAIQLAPDVVEGTRERFRAGSVFSRPCPHANAARREQAVAALAQGDRPRAVKLMRAICKDAPEEPRFKMELGDFLGGGSDEERGEATSLWSSIAESNTVTSSLRADALERLARVASTAGDIARTTALIAKARELPVDQNAKRQLEAEWFALHHTGPAAVPLQGYFFGGPTRSPIDGTTWALMIALAEPDLGFGYYLLGLQLFNANDWHRSAIALDYSLTRGLPDLSFVKNGARRLVVAAYRSHDLPLVERAIAALRGPGMSETDKLLADDFAARLHFDADGHL